MQKLKVILFLGICSNILNSGNPQRKYICKLEKSSFCPQKLLLIFVLSTTHQPYCFLLTLSLKTWRKCFILNCQIYHKQCRKERDMLIKFTTTTNNRSELSNCSHHILTGDLLHKTQHMFVLYFLI